MRVKLEFDLPEDEWEFKRAVNGSNLHCAITSFRERLKNILKHDDYATDTHQEIYDMLYQELDDNDITLD
jgi:hypothetical protein